MNGGQKVLWEKVRGVGGCLVIAAVAAFYLAVWVDTWPKQPCDDACRADLLARHPSVAAAVAAREAEAAALLAPRREGN